jgi:purine-binding chemotaxis protein CheW
MMTQTQECNAVAPAPRAGKYLTFHLGKEQFGIQVIHIREIIGIQDITAGPGPLKGGIKLRGKNIPVVDLRLKFNFREASCPDTTCIVVVQAEQDGGSAMIGLIVDSVSEVRSLDRADLEDVDCSSYAVPNSLFNSATSSVSPITFRLSARALSSFDPASSPATT